MVIAIFGTLASFFYACVKGDRERSVLEDLESKVYQAWRLGSAFPRYGSARMRRDALMNASMWGVTRGGQWVYELKGMATVTQRPGRAEEAKLVRDANREKVVKVRMSMVSSLTARPSAAATTHTLSASRLSDHDYLPPPGS